MATKKEKKVVRQGRPEDSYKPAELEHCRKLLDIGALGSKLCLGPRIGGGSVGTSQDNLLAEMVWIAVDIFEQKKRAVAQCKAISQAVREFWDSRKRSPAKSAAALVQSYMMGIAFDISPSLLDGVNPESRARIQILPAHSSGEKVGEPRGRGLRDEKVRQLHEKQNKQSSQSRGNVSTVSALMREYSVELVRDALKSRGASVPLSRHASDSAVKLEASPSDDDLTSTSSHDTYTTVPVTSFGFGKQRLEEEAEMLLRQSNGELCRGIAVPPRAPEVASNARSEVDAYKSVLTEMEFTSLMAKHPELFPLAADAIDFLSSSSVSHRLKRDKESGLDDPLKRRARGAMSTEDHNLRKSYLSSLLSAHRHGAVHPWDPVEDAMLEMAVRRSTYASYTGNVSINWGMVAVVLGGLLTKGRLRGDFGRSAMQCEKRFREKVREDPALAELSLPDLFYPTRVRSPRLQVAVAGLPPMMLQPFERVKLPKFTGNFTPLERRGVVVRKNRGPSVAVPREQGVIKAPPHAQAIPPSTVILPWWELALHGSSSRQDAPTLEALDTQVSSALNDCLVEKKRSQLPSRAFPVEDLQAANPRGDQDHPSHDSWAEQASIAVSRFGVSDTATLEELAAEVLKKLDTILPRQAPKKPGRVVQTTQSHRPSLYGNPTPPVGSPPPAPSPPLATPSPFPTVAVPKQEVPASPSDKKKPKEPGVALHLITGGANASVSLLANVLKQHSQSQLVQQNAAPSLSALAPPKPPGIPPLTIPVVASTLPPIATRSGTVLQQPSQPSTPRRAPQPPRRASTMRKPS